MGRYHFYRKLHAHTLDGKPLIGTTTALGIISKPLTWWASGMACAEFGWRNPKKASVEEVEEAASQALADIQELNIDGYIKLLNKAYRAHSTSKDKAADKGIDLHSMVEDFIKASMSYGVVGNIKVDGYFVPKEIESFVSWAKENVSQFIASELHCYSEVLFAGGIVDFLYIDKNDNLVLGDIKSSKEPYFSHWAQLGAYHLQIEENGLYDPDGELLIDRKALKPISHYAVFCAGKSLGEPFFCYETARCRRAFSYAINLYREKLFFEKED